MDAQPAPPKRPRRTTVRNVLASIGFLFVAVFFLVIASERGWIGSWPVDFLDQNPIAARCWEIGPAVLIAALVIDSVVTARKRSE